MTTKVAINIPTKVLPNKKKEKKEKRWTWSKPKDKPKRPLSAYNIFFKHVRSRIVKGLPEEGTEEEVIASIKDILAEYTTKKKRDRTTHGKISFGNLASTVSLRWKNTDPRKQAIFQRYADMDKKRYFFAVAVWKAKKEAEEAAAAQNLIKITPVVWKAKKTAEQYFTKTTPQPITNGIATEQYFTKITPQPITNNIATEQYYTKITPQPITNNIATEQYFTKTTPQPITNGIATEQNFTKITPQPITSGITTEQNYTKITPEPITSGIVTDSKDSSSENYDESENNSDYDYDDEYLII